MTCAQCRFYDAPTCRLARSSNTYPARLHSKAVAHASAGINGRVGDAWLEVRPDFGCVQFAAKEAESASA